MRLELEHKIKLLLEKYRKAVLSTCGPAGVQAGLFTCHYHEGIFFVLIPSIADILDNVTTGCAILVTAASWQITGSVCICPPGHQPENFNLIHEKDAAHCILVKITPCRIQLSPHNGWGFAETIDFE